MLSIPFILWLHLFRQRPKSKKVSSLILWSTLQPTNIAGPQKEKLSRSLSLYLELLVALLLSLLLAQPKSCLSEAEHLIYIIDTSASMTAQDLHLSILQNIQDELQSMGPENKVTIISAGNTPSIVIGPYGHTWDALQQLAELQFLDSNADIAEGINIAKNITSGQIVVWSDHPPPTDNADFPMGDNITWHAIGKSLPNIGIVQAKIHQNELQFKIANANDTDAQAEVMLKIDQNQQSESIVIPANATLEKNYQLPSQFQDCEIILSPLQEDGLQVDNKVYLTKNNHRSIKLSLDLPETFQKKMGLFHGNAIAPIERLGFNIEWVTALQADILFTNRTLGGGPNTWRITILSDDSTHKLSTTLFSNKQHPLLHNVQMGNVVWAFDPKRKLEGLPLIEINGQPVMSEVIQNDGLRRVYTFNWHPLYSNWTQQPSWPILLSTLLQQRNLLIPGLLQSNIEGHDLLKIIDAEPGKWVLQNQDKSKALTHQKGTLYLPPLGFGKNILQPPNQKEAYVIGVNLNSPLESDLRKNRTEHIKSSVEFEKIEEPSPWLNHLLLLCALLFWLWNCHITGKHS